MLTLSHLVRAIAQARQIPFVDYHRTMMPLPDYGLGVVTTTATDDQANQVSIPLYLRVAGAIFADDFESGDLENWLW